MHFVFLAPRFHTNQADLVRKLQDEGHRVSFLVALSTHSEDHSRTQPVILRQTRFGAWLDRHFNPSGDIAARAAYTAPSIGEVWARLRELRPDVVVIRSFPGLFILEALPWLVAKRVCVVVYTQRPKFDPNASFARRVRMALLLGILDIRWFTAVERYLRNDTDRDLHSRIVFIPFFKYADPSAANRTYGAGARFFAVSKFVRRKNLAALIEAFASLSAEPAPTLTIVGENTRPEHAVVLQELRRRAQDLGVSERVEFRQNIRYADVQALYGQRDVFMMCSYSEPASVSQVEAMAHGMAVVCNRDNGTAHYVDHEVTGLLVDSDVASIAAAMRRYTAEPTLARRHGQAGLAKLRGPYSVDQGYAKLLELVTRPSWWHGSSERQDRWQVGGGHSSKPPERTICR